MAIKKESEILLDRGRLVSKIIPATQSAQHINGRFEITLGNQNLYEPFPSEFSGSRRLKERINSS